MYCSMFVCIQCARFMLMLQVISNFLCISVAELQCHILIWHVYYICFVSVSWFCVTQIFLETRKKKDCMLWLYLDVALFTILAQYFLTDTHTHARTHTHTHTHTHATFINVMFCSTTYEVALYFTYNTDILNNREISQF